MSFPPAHKNRSAFLLKSFLVIALLMILAANVSKLNAQDKAAQQDQPLRLKAELVEIRAVVTDKKGNVIKNLNKEDFELFDSDRAQNVSFFSAEDLGSPKALPDLKQLQQGAEKRESAEGWSGRTIVIFVDSLHISTTNMLRLRETLLSFINDQLTDRDVVAVVTSSGSLGVFGQFTQDKQVLRNAVERLAGSAESRPNTLYTPYLAAQVDNDAPFALDVAMNIVRAEETLPDDPHFLDIIKSIARTRAREIISEANFRTRSTLLTLKAVADRLAQMPGQRLILMMSDGFTMLDTGGITDPSDLQAVISRASRSGVVVYSFAAKGLTGSPLYSASNSGRFSANAGTANKIQSFILAGDKELDNGLNRVAKETGGEAFLTTNDLNAALGKMLDDNSFYYSLAYYPAANDSKKNFRRIKLRVKGHSEYNVRTQSGYLASDLNKEIAPDVSNRQQKLLQAMNSPLASTQIEIDASADFLELQSDGAQVSLQIYADGKKLKYAEEDKFFVSNLAMMIEVINAKGMAESIKQDAFQIRLSPEQYKQAQQNVYRNVKRLQLRPGLYQIRVGVRDQNTDLIGTAVAWVEVPDLSSKKLALGGVSLANVQADKPLPQSEMKRAAVQPVIKRGTSVFRSADSIAYFSRAYNAPSMENARGELRVQTQILQGAKVLIEGAWQPLSSLVISGEKDSVEFGGQLSLKTLRPGAYELRVLVADRKSGRVLQQGKAFEVQP